MHRQPLILPESTTILSAPKTLTIYLSGAPGNVKPSFRKNRNIAFYDQFMQRYLKLQFISFVHQRPHISQKNAWERWLMWY